MALQRLEIHSTKAVMQMERDPMVLRVKRTPPRMKVNRRLPTFRISNTQELLGTQVGRRGPSAHSRRMVQQARQAMLEGIRRTNNRADQYANFYRYGDTSVVAQVSLSGVLEQSKPVFDTVPIPAPFPEVEWDMGEMSIDWEQGDLEMTWEGDPMPDISFTPHSVEIRLVSGEVIRVGEAEAKAIERQGYGKRLDTEA